MYCVKCGVQLGEAEQKCPLCNTVVCHPDFKPDPQKALYPSDKMPKIHSGKKAISGAVIILFLLPLVLSFFSDLQSNGKLEWFGFVAGGLAVTYITFALPLWFKKPLPIIFAPCDFLALTLYVFYINAATGGNWFLTFALPILVGLCLITCAFIALTYYVKRGRLYVWGGASALLGGLIFLTEFLLDYTFGVEFIGWSTYPFAVFFLLGGLLIYLAINSAARETIKRKFFF